MAVRRAYAKVVDGVEPVEPESRGVAFLVNGTSLVRGDDDTYVAAGLGRHFARQRFGVRLVPRDEWYETEYGPDELLVAMVPTVDIRRIPAGIPVVAWVRNQVQKWRGLPALEEYAAVLTTSELSLALLVERYRGPSGVLANGFDEDLFAAGQGRHGQARSAVTAVDPKSTNRELQGAARRLPADTPLSVYGSVVPADRSNARFHRGAADHFGLPEVYRNSALTIDRVDGADTGWGGHSSRLLEAIACGSPVATNTPLGLRELGLEALPIYRSIKDVQNLVGRAGAGEFADLATQLRDVVHGTHGYRARAAAFVEFATQHDLWRRGRRPTSVINFFPDWTRGNPYQRMLYARLPDGVRHVASVDPVSRLVLRDDGGDVSGQVLHVHWQNFVLQPSHNHAEASRRLREVTANITDLLGRGMKLIWTIHNRLPHDLDYYFDEVELCRFLAHNADVIHVLSQETFDAVHNLFDLDPDKVVVVEHGSYVGVYPELLDRVTARERLGLLPSENVVLFFGAIRPYKGLEQLIEVFQRIHYADPTTRLLLVGQPGRTMDQAFLDRLQRLPFVTTQFGFVPESDVHLYFRAADVQVAPYTAVLNSGSVLLGLGFGLPVVAPDLGALRSLASEPFLFSYRAQDAEQLRAALRSALDRCHDAQVSEQAVAFAERYTGDDMSDKFVRGVLGRLQ